MKFEIGNWVSTSQAMRRHVHANDVSWQPYQFKNTVMGQVVGYARREDGTRKVDAYAEQRYLSVSQQHAFVLVRLGLFNKPIFVEEDSLHLLSPQEVKDLPTLYITKHWDEWGRNAMRETMEDWPRDSKGRWIAENKQDT